MSDADGLRKLVVLDETVPAGKPWGHAVGQGEILRLVDLEGQQAVDFLCFDAADPTDRYSTTQYDQSSRQHLYRPRHRTLLGSRRCVVYDHRRYLRSPRHDLRLL